MAKAIYAGSFDPWSYGHQYVLDAALEIFEEVHIIIGVNPSKVSKISPEDRARLIAHSQNPWIWWWDETPPFQSLQKLQVSLTQGLIATYAEERQIFNLVRGLRSTTDFEAEFNLYFSNHALKPKLKTWTLLCPPELLHCSSTFVKSVVGNPVAEQVGTSFAGQSLLMEASLEIGIIFDLIQNIAEKYHGLSSSSAYLSSLHKKLQFSFGKLCHKIKSEGLPVKPELQGALKAYMGLEVASGCRKAGSDSAFELKVIALWDLLVAHVPCGENLAKLTKFPW